MKKLSKKDYRKTKRRQARKQLNSYRWQLLEEREGLVDEEDYVCWADQIGLSPLEYSWYFYWDGAWLLARNQIDHRFVFAVWGPETTAEDDWCSMYIGNNNRPYYIWKEVTRVDR